MDDVSFERKVNMLQAEKGISLTALSKRVGKSRQCVYRLKKSKRPRPVTINKFAKALEVPVSHFFD